MAAQQDDQVGPVPAANDHHPPPDAAVLAAVAGEPKPRLLLPRVPKTYAEDHNTPLHVACYKGSYSDVLMLLLSGQDILSRNIWNETPLHQSTAQGHLEIMMLLLDSGADANSTDHQDLTPLHLAVIHGNRDAAELLLCYGASIFGGKGVKDLDTMSVLELSEHVPVCTRVIANALGKVWSLQHLCRVSIRRHLGPSKRRRIKELPLPKHVLTFLCSLPVEKTQVLHQNWDRMRSVKSETVRKRNESRKPKQPRYVGGGLQAIKHQ